MDLHRFSYESITHKADKHALERKVGNMNSVSILKDSIGTSTETNLVFFREL